MRFNNQLENTQGQGRDAGDYDGRWKGQDEDGERDAFTEYARRTRRQLK